MTFVLLCLILVESTRLELGTHASVWCEWVVRLLLLLLVRQHLLLVVINIDLHGHLWVL